MVVFVIFFSIFSFRYAPKNNQWEEKTELKAYGIFLLFEVDLRQSVWL